MLDGAGHHKIFWKISLPLVLGPISALYIITLIGFWNDYMSSLMYMPSFQTIASGLFVYKQVAAQKFMNMPVYYAGVIVSTIPAVIIFILFQDKIMTSITVGGLKG
jgi:ABC-type glycerol-3-phosphate transport system permease component